MSVFTIIGRQFVGLEVDGAWVDHANRRIAAATPGARSRLTVTRPA